MFYYFMFLIRKEMFVLIMGEIVKWVIKGEFFFVDIGCLFYVVKFLNMDDYNYVLI